MPHGAPVDLTGTLLRDGRRLVLAVSGGGEWIIDPPLFAGAHRLIGKRVRVIGVRGGFNLVDAHRLEAR